MIKGWQLAHIIQPITDNSEWRVTAVWKSNERYTPDYIHIAHGKTSEIAIKSLLKLCKKDSYWPVIVKPFNPAEDTKNENR